MAQAIKYTWMGICGLTLILIFYGRYIQYQDNLFCEQYGEATFRESQVMGDQCMINDPELGWISYAELVLLRLTEIDR